MPACVHSNATVAPRFWMAAKATSASTQALGVTSAPGGKSKHCLSLVATFCSSLHAHVPELAHQLCHGRGCGKVSILAVQVGRLPADAVAVRESARIHVAGRIRTASSLCTDWRHQQPLR